MKEKRKRKKRERKRRRNTVNNSPVNSNKSFENLILLKPSKDFGDNELVP